MSQLSDCARLLRRYDYDRFLTGLFAPADRREALYAVYAFNLEIARTREAVSEPMLGQIRLQWWREAIEEIYAGRARRHEVVEPLAIAVADLALPRAAFDRLIDAREADLSDTVPENLEELGAYARETGGAILNLAGAVLGATDEASVGALEATGTAYALAGILRAVPFHARSKRQLLPADLVRDAGLAPSDYFELRPVAQIVPVVKTVAERASRELAAARAKQSSIDRAALPALLHARLADLYLARLARGGHQPMQPRREVSALRKQMALYWAMRRGRV